MANNNLAAIAQLWAREGLLWLIENCPELSIVDRQFSSTLARHGETVNAYRAGTRKTRRKVGTDGFTHADAELEPVAVPLNQWFYDSCILRDDELSMSIVDLIPTHLGPMMGGIARGMARGISGRAVSAFLRQGEPTKRAGGIGAMTKTNSADYILEAEEILNLNNAPAGTRIAVVHPTAFTKLQLNELFARADARGGAGAVMTGQVGRVYNTQVIMSQCVNYAYLPSLDTQDSSINNSGGYDAGEDGALTVVDPGTNWTVGEYAVVAGNDQPTYISATNGTTSITLNEALKYDVIDTAVIKHYLKVTNEATERLAGYQKTMEFTHSAGKNLQVGQLLSFGTTSRHTYTIIEVDSTTSTTTTVLLDRPLDATVAASADAFPGPGGGAFNYVMDPRALTMVTRPPILLPAEFGVAMSVQSYKGIGLRVSAQYDSAEGGVRINADILAGFAPLDTNLLVTLLS